MRNISRGSLKISLLASLGSCFEYYDFVIYGMMAKYLSTIFFPAEGGELSGIIQVFLILMVGYLVRPLGGIVIGLIADSYGRKKAFVISMFMMGFSTLAIGLLPTWNQIGIFAPILLAICRISQGLAFGAELPNAVTIVSESVTKSKLGFLCGFVLSGTSLGALLANYILFTLNSNFTIEEINNNVWRIPFILGGIFAISTYYIRKNVNETPEFLGISENNSSKINIHNLYNIFTTLISQYWPQIFLAFGLALFIATLIISNIYLPIYLNQYFSYSFADIYKSIALSLVASSIYMVVLGWVSDRIPKIYILAFTIFSFLALLLPLYNLLQMRSTFVLQIFFLIDQLWISMFFTSCLPVITNLFPVKVRATGFAISYNIAYSAASIIPVGISYLSKEYNDSPFYLGIFIVIAGIISLSSILIIIFTSKTNTLSYQVRHNPII